MTSPISGSTRQSATARSPPSMTTDGEKPVRGERVKLSTARSVSPSRSRDLGSLRCWPASPSVFEHQRTEHDIIGDGVTGRAHEHGLKYASLGCAATKLSTPSRWPGSPPQRPPSGWKYRSLSSQTSLRYPPAAGGTTSEITSSIDTVVVCVSAMCPPSFDRTAFWGVLSLSDAPCERESAPRDARGASDVF